MKPFVLGNLFPPLARFDSKLCREPQEFGVLRFALEFRDVDGGQPAGHDQARNMGVDENEAHDEGRGQQPAQDRRGPARNRHARGAPACGIEEDWLICHAAV